ncbi:RNA-directed DNA polymerase, eukaryota [Tanacetum coccineum]
MNDQTMIGDEDRINSISEMGNKKRKKRGQDQFVLGGSNKGGSGSPSGSALSGSINSMRVKSIGEQIGIVWDKDDNENTNVTVGVSNEDGKGKQNEADRGDGFNQYICYKEKPCVLAIQEMKCKRVADQWVENVWGTRNFGFVQIEARGRSGGLLLVWDTNSFSVKQSVREDRFVAVMGTWKGRVGYIIFVNVYGPHPSNQKGALWKRLEELINSNDGAWCLLGDFNEVRNLDDRLNTQFHARDSDEFNTFIANTRMVEVPMGGRRFTRVREDGMKFSKLDRFLISEEFKQMWGNLAAVALDRKLSDHCPIVLKYIDVDFGPRPFRSLDMWLNELDIEQVVAEAWAKPVRVNRQDCIVRGKFKNVKMALKRWSKARLGAMDNQIEVYREEAMRWELEEEARDLRTRMDGPTFASNRVIKLSDIEAKNLEARFTEK